MSKSPGLTADKTVSLSDESLLKGEDKKILFIKVAHQLTKKNCSLKEVIAGLPQGFTDGALLFNLFINDLFLFICVGNLNNYADDNNLFATGTDIQLINQML